MNLNHLITISDADIALWRIELKSGDKAQVDGLPVTVRQSFPTGSTSFSHPHCKVDFDDGDRNVAIPLAQIKPIKPVF